METLDRPDVSRMHFAEAKEALRKWEANNMKPHANPLFADDVCPTADLTEIAAPTIFVRKRGPSHRRSIRDLRRQQTAAEAIGGLDHSTQIVGFTKGQFSVIDLIRATLAITGKTR